MLAAPVPVDVRRAVVITIAAAAAVVTAGCSLEERGSGEEAAPVAGGSSRPARGLPDGARCESLKQRYEQARSGSAVCERDDECVLEPRGRFFTGLDGCFRARNRGFDIGAADRIAKEWLDGGCAGSFELCSPSLGSGACRDGVCLERPPPPVAEDWGRVDIAETFSLFLPPEIIEVPYSRTCGNGPAMRLFHGPGLRIRVEYGYELSYLPLTDDGKDELPPVLSVVRTKRKMGTREATLLTYYSADFNSKATAPDGSWPPYHLVRALSLQNIDAPVAGSLWLGSGSGPVSLAISIEGERAHEPIAARILEWVSFW
jgi:hypothetical protein